jgi:MFS family permease
MNRTTIKLVFLIQAVASASFLPRIPDLQSGLGIDAAVLGLTLIGQPVGALSMFPFSSRIVERFGTRLALLAGIPLMATFLFLMSVAPSPVWLFVVFAGYGASFALTNVAQNVEADRVEAATIKRIMNTCHGVWSVGQLAAFGIGVLARGLNVPPLWHFGIFLPIVLIAVAFVILPMQAAPARAHAAAATTKRFRLALPSVATLWLLGFMLGSALVEGSTRQWSVIYARDSFVAAEWAQALTLPIFVGAVALGRFFGDSWTTRYGVVGLARVLLVIAFAGALIVVLAPNLPVALIGFALMGFGICTAFPAGTSAAAQLGDRPSSENVAALTMSMQTVMLGAPALMGFVADTFGIRATFALVLPALAVAIYLARRLEPKRIA